MKPLSLLLACCLAMLATGCNRTDKQSVAIIGLTCEAPIFVAYEKGFFKEEGLDVELVRTDWDGLREGLGLGRFDAIQTLTMYMLKPMEQGLDAKITGGIHTGCLRIQVPPKSDIKTVKDLKGKKIGVPTHIGSPPFLYASRVLAASGIDPSPNKNDVTWVAFPPEMLGKAVETGQVDAIATSDPIGTILVGMGLVRTISDQAIDAPYCDEYCCVVAVSGRLAKSNPAVAAKLTRAMLKGAKWVEANSKAAATLAVEKKYTSASIEVNAQALAQLKYTPGVASCKRTLVDVAKEMRTAELLQADTQPDKLAARCWLDLDGVSDDWLKGLSVERVEGGGRPAPMHPSAFALLCDGGKMPRGCCD